MIYRCIVQILYKICTQHYICIICEYDIQYVQMKLGTVSKRLCTNRSQILPTVLNSALRQLELKVTNGH